MEGGYSGAMSNLTAHGTKTWAAVLHAAAVAVLIILAIGYGGGGSGGGSGSGY
jgi:hypothetical protein